MPTSTYRMGKVVPIKSQFGGLFVILKDVLGSTFAFVGTLLAGQGTTIRLHPGLSRVYQYQSEVTLKIRYVGTVTLHYLERQSFNSKVVDGVLWHGEHVQIPLLESKTEYVLQSRDIQYSDVEPLPALSLKNETADSKLLNEIASTFDVALAKPRYSLCDDQNIPQTKYGPSNFYTVSPAILGTFFDLVLPYGPVKAGTQWDFFFWPYQGINRLVQYSASNLTGNTLTVKAVMENSPLAKMIEPYIYELDLGTGVILKSHGSIELGLATDSMIMPTVVTLRFNRRMIPPP